MVPIAMNSESDSPSRAELDLEVARLHEECCAELLAYAFLIARSADASHDAVQEAFLRYFIERSYGRSVDYPRAWLYRVVRNYLLGRMDTAATRHEVEQDQAANLPDENHGPEEMLRNAQMAEQLRSLLSPREIECLSLRADGLSYEEIGEVLGIRPGTVSAFLTRVHNKLRDAVRTGQECQSATIEALYRLIGGGGTYSTY
jgi:RNA polymerase sigma-70 factor, ECF subfamily